MTVFLSDYGFYVWTAYAVSFLALGLTAVLTVLAHRRARRSLRRLEMRKGVEVSETNL